MSSSVNLPPLIDGLVARIANMIEERHTTNKIIVGIMKCG
jgi:hypothetical protein